MKYKKPYRSIIPLLLLIGILTFSCEDRYPYDNGDPEWLGESIYEYLKDTTNFSYYTKLIEDVGDYKEILSKTGSKTLFVADDDAFERFFASNEWGVSSYDQLSEAQKTLILTFGMINNAYQLKTLANYYDGGLKYGTALRRENASSVQDTIPFIEGQDLPLNESFDRYRTTGIYLLDDNTPTPMVHFLDLPLISANISDDDFEKITGKSRSGNDAHIFDVKVIERDITCKNGYIHVLEDVLLPRKSMAKYVTDNENTSTFSRLLDRFSGAYYFPDVNEDYKAIHPEFTDSIFVKKYSSYERGNGYVNVYWTGSTFDESLILPINPGWNSYTRGGVDGALESDMAAMLVPTDQAMDDYFNTGEGIILKEKYGSWEKIPNEVIIKFLKRHLRSSFIETVPSRFGSLTDDQNSPIPITEDDVVDTYVGVNGVVYITNNVYRPDDYVSVYAPVLLNRETSTGIFWWAIENNDFTLYLNSLLSTYSFFVPTDEFFENYIDPVAYAKDVPAVLKYYYDEEDKTVYATAYAYNRETGEVGVELADIEDPNFISDRLLDLLDTHIIVGDVESGEKYYMSKGGNPIIVEGAGEDLMVWGGGDVNQGVTTNVTSVFEQDNGKTYFIDKPIQTPLQSVYKVLSETEEFSNFFSLLTGFPASSEHEVFKKTTNYYGVDYNIKFFNTFNYTVYVPTNAAIDTALARGYISSWSMINDITNDSTKNAEIENLARFLRYHFQDNSVFISGSSVDNVFQTATIKTDDSQTRFNTYQNKYYKLGVTGDGSSLSLLTELTDQSWQAEVITDEGLFNIMTRDYIFSGNPLTFSEIDGSGTGPAFTTSEIVTSSTAVIHQIDNVLLFE